MPRRYWDIQATLVNGKIQLDTCGDDGYFRSTNAGAQGSWSTADTPPYFSYSFGTQCRIAVAPNDPSTVFIASLSSNQLWETTGTGAPWTWTPNDTFQDIFGRPMSWVETHPGFSGNSTDFEVYFYGGWNVVHQTCSVNNSPRCPGFWSELYPYEGQLDGSAIVFDPATPNGSPLFVAGDQGVFSFALGGATTGASTGLNALWVWPDTVAGGLFPDGTHLYMGTQDNGLFISRDGGRTWPIPPFYFLDGDFLALAANRNTTEELAYVTCCGMGTPPLSLSGIPGPPNILTLCPSLGLTTAGPLTNFGLNSFALIEGGTEDCFDHLWVTTDSGATWTQMGPTLPGYPAWIHLKTSNPAGLPTFYIQHVLTPNDGIFRISGPLDGSATVTDISAGLNYVEQGKFAVSPADPNFLYVSVLDDPRSVTAGGQMMFTRDGGVTWKPDTTLTSLITHNGEFWYRSRIFLPFNEVEGYTGQPSAIAFDSSGNTIVVGTHTAGIFISFDQGAHWQEVPGSEQIPSPSGFFFDDSTGAIFVGSAGRGMWRIDTSGKSK
jgi:hypothetical protein